jgi:hypothetical protein
VSTEYILHEDPEDFFKSDGVSVMMFSRAAAKRIFELAGSRGIEIWRYEGGILRDGIFQAKLDAIWDRLNRHKGMEFLEEGNLRAAATIVDEHESYNSFTITAGPMK